MPMELRRLWEDVLVRPEDLSPSRDDFEVAGVFNPGVMQCGKIIYLLLRVAERPKNKKTGMIGLPRWQASELTVDWIDQQQIEYIDPRVIRLKQDGSVRLTFTSHLRVATSLDGRSIESFDHPRIIPRFEWEEYGIEDPRITKINDSYYFTYVAVSRHGAATALASTRDFVNFHRHGIIFPPENKDVLLFPEQIGGKFAALHRPNPATQFSRPEIWLAWSSDLIHWGSHEPLCFEGGPWESGRVGGGVPPVATDQGWLEIYHGNRRSQNPGEVGEYTAGALLLDLENPAKILKRTRGPVLSPQSDFERRGFVPNVVFPTGMVDCGETFLIYYGAADTNTGVVEVSRKELMDLLSDVFQ